MSSMPSFDDFYESVHGRRPFPWQRRLARQVAHERRWPSEIGVPTGLGKTSCLDVAIWWLASEADAPGQARAAPTRIWWLVNRRLLVDATADHAQRLATLLRSEGSGPITAVGERLRTLSADPGADPLEVVRLRGGVAAGRPTDPSQPAVILSTLPMYGSRLLFRGYGTSRSMRPIDAALAGTDSLVLVDEAHLARHLMALFEPLEACDPAAEEVLPRTRPVVVSLTATGGSLSGRLDLDEEDLDDPTVAQRVGARKPTRLVELSPRSDVASHLVAAAAELLDEADAPSSCVVFANTPSRARQVGEAVARRWDEDVVDLVVLTGQQRERESAAARRRVLDPESGAPAGRPTTDRQRHLVVVATQTLEVGADLDFAHMVTEACGVRALTQRLGRLNRLGQHSDATASYVHAEPPARGAAAPTWPVYREEPATVIRRLRAAAADGTVDLGPGAVGDVLGTPMDDPGRAPELLPALLWEWVKTTTPPPGEAPVEPYFSGFDRPARNVSVCWRAHVPATGQRIWPRVTDREVVEVSLDAEARDALIELPAIHRLAPDRVTLELTEVGDLAPGDVVILACTDGLLDIHGWNPHALGLSVVDVSLAGRGLPLDRTALERLATDPPAAALAELLGNEDPDEEGRLIQSLVDTLKACSPRAASEEEWADLLASLDVERVVAQPDEVPRLLARSQTPQTRIDALDELSAGAAATALTAHGLGVGLRARAVATAAGLSSPAVMETVERAARFHDLGKADARFQRWLDPAASSDELLAKSSTPTSRWTAARVASGWPRGGRHEALSARLVQEWIGAAEPAVLADLDLDLLLHLVVSHHGHARPLLLPVADPTASAPVEASVDGMRVTAKSDLSDVDWDQPGRFAELNRRYGQWGLALLEAIVRQSDHAVSAGAWAGEPEAVV